VVSKLYIKNIIQLIRLYSIVATVLTTWRAYTYTIYIFLF